MLTINSKDLNHVNQSQSVCELPWGAGAQPLSDITAFFPECTGKHVVAKHCGRTPEAFCSCEALSSSCLTVLGPVSWGLLFESQGLPDRV